MRRSALFAILSAAVLAAPALGFAQSTSTSVKTEGESKLKVDDVSGKKNKVDGNIDEEVTNARMRAESGSKSKLSMSMGVGFTGGSVSRAFGQERPNIKGVPGTQRVTSADIGVSGRYRWSKKDSATFGTSVSMYTPFQGDVDKDETQLTLNDPSVGYNRVGKVGVFQTNMGVSGYWGTSQPSKAVKNYASGSFSYSALYAFQNRLTVGSAVITSYMLYDNKPGQPTEEPTAKANFYGGDTRTQWTLGLFPFAEYSFTDKLSARTVFGYFNWRHLYGDNNRYRLLQQYVYQSVGVGISVTRDIYLYPNVQFIPDDIRSDRTNVALSATINMF